MTVVNCSTLCTYYIHCVPVSYHNMIDDNDDDNNNDGDNNDDNNDNNNDDSV